MQPTVYYYNGWNIERELNNDNNTIVLKINGKLVEICLSGRNDLMNVQTLSEALSDLRNGLRNLDDNLVRSTINHLGGRAALRIMEALMPEIATAFFLHQL